MNNYNEGKLHWWTKCNGRHQIEQECPSQENDSVITNWNHVLVLYEEFWRLELGFHVPTEEAQVTEEDTEIGEQSLS